MTTFQCWHNIFHLLLTVRKNRCKALGFSHYPNRSGDIYRHNNRKALGLGKLKTNRHKICAISVTALHSALSKLPKSADEKDQKLNSECTFKNIYRYIDGQMFLLVYKLNYTMLHNSCPPTDKVECQTPNGESCT